MPLPPWMADLTALDLLVSVAELGSVGPAAQAHLMTQPIASARVTDEVRAAIHSETPAGAH